MAIKNANDGTETPPYLRLGISAGNLFDLPPESSLPQDHHEIHKAVKGAGFSAIQGGANSEYCNQLGLLQTGGGRINEPHEADAFAKQQKASGYDLATLHVGWGMESNEKIDALLKAIIEASAKHDIPLYVETHRATITQDICRTVDFALRNPDIRFNGDFSHWYTGLEMVYGGMEQKLDFLQPVFDRVRFLHGRIGNPGSMQVDVGNSVAEAKKRSYVQHFQEMWTRSFMGFLKSAKPGDYISFTPELLGPVSYYARLIKNAKGQMVEECDRWQQAKLYAELAKDCFAAAAKRLK